MLARQSVKKGRASVLLVEDEPLLRAFIAEELRAAGLCVVEAGDGDEAWGYAAAGGDFDLLFSDIQMPGSMSGTDLARKLKSQTPDLDVFLTSGRAEWDRQAGARAFFRKPYAFDEVVAAVVAAARAKRGARRE